MIKIGINMHYLWNVINIEILWKYAQWGDDLVCQSFAILWIPFEKNLKLDSVWFFRKIRHYSKVKKTEKNSPW